MSARPLPSATDAAPAVPTVSVVITTTGRPELARAVRSALTQTRAALEVIVVHDSPTAPALDLPPGAVPVRVLPSRARGGNAARNTGVAAAAGDLVALLDDDDWFFADKLERQVAHLLEGELDVVSCQCFDEYRGRMLPRDTYRAGELSRYLFRRSLLRPAFDHQIQTSSLLVRRSLLTATPFDEALAFHQDWDWLLRVDSAGARFGMVPLPLYFFAASAGGKVSRRARIAAEQQWAAQVLADRPVCQSGYLWTVSLPRSIEAGEYRLAVRTVRRSLGVGGLRPGSVFSGTLYAVAILARRLLRGRSMVTSDVER